MSKADPLRQIPLLYHFTDRRNLPLIRKLGGLYPRAELEEKAIKVPAPGGNQWSRDADEMKGMHQYVHLCLRVKTHRDYSPDIPVECAFQGSKVFEHGGPYTDLYEADARSAKHDPRLYKSGRLVGFKFDNLSFPLEPKTAFYDWLYINAIFPHREWLKRLYRYAGYTDIEFNPARSINCQARSCALFVALMKRDLRYPPPNRFSI
jgi:hypothetical protein